MKAETIISAVAAAVAVLAAVVNIVLSIFSKKMDYEFEYKKYILKKRQETYDKLLPIMQILHSVSVYDMGRTTFPSIFDVRLCEGKQTRNPVYAFSEEHRDILKDRMWLSVKMDSYMVRLNHLLKNIMNDLAVEPSRDPTTTELATVGKKYSKEVKELANSVIQTFFIDMCELSDIRKFKRRARYISRDI